MTDSQLQEMLLDLLAAALDKRVVRMITDSLSMNKISFTCITFSARFLRKVRTDAVAFRLVKPLSFLLCAWSKILRNSDHRVRVTCGNLA